MHKLINNHIKYNDLVNLIIKWIEIKDIRVMGGVNHYIDKNIAKTL